MSLMSTKRVWTLDRHPSVLAWLRSSLTLSGQRMKSWGIIFKKIINGHFTIFLTSFFSCCSLKPSTWVSAVCTYGGCWCKYIMHKLMVSFEVYTSKKKRAALSYSSHLNNKKLLKPSWALKKEEKQNKKRNRFHLYLLLFCSVLLFSSHPFLTFTKMHMNAKHTSTATKEIPTTATKGSFNNNKSLQKTVD